MNRWVYRRPFFRAAKPKIPLFRRGTPLFPQRRLRIARRRVVRRIRRALVLGKASASSVFVRAIRRAVAHRRAVHRRIPIPGTSAQGRTGVIARRRLIRKIKARYRQQKTQPPGTKFTGKTGVLGRVLKAIGRMRRQMQKRLRWKPREIPPEITPPSTQPHATPRGSVFSAGSVAGDIYSAGSKRGSIF
jgi:hypothetical protein